MVLFWALTGGRGPNPAKKLGREVDAINAKADIKRIQVDLDEERALAHVENKYRDDLAAMDDEKRARADKLKKDPAKLAAFIVRGQG